MLGKVMKHEMKATWKVLFPLAMVLVGVTLIGMLMMKMQVFETDIGALVGLAMLLLYIIGLIALSVTAFIFLLVRFYHSMYGAEGYLSHTLPVTTFSLINGKLLVAVFWHAITSILVYVSAFSLIVTAGLNLGNEGERIKLEELLQSTLASHIDAITSYPDREYTSLRKCIAAYTGTDASQVIVGNGSTELISLFIQIEHPKKAMILGPTYSEYEREISLGGGTTLYYPLREKDDFVLDVDDFTAHLNESIDLLVLCNPNNPTSSCINRTYMRLRD